MSFGLVGSSPTSGVILTDLSGGFNRYNNANSDNYKKMKQLVEQFTTVILTTNTNIFEKVIKITKL